ncbi:FlgB family protein [Roseovarius pelagicus]|uniref:FlgB family protein n=2 Tax=Roseovarius pelagicus TaxID=2980108 RepID=A0ABY6DGE0_9RHOB|nr:FlgB family protein [Roseovarius pelagicus]
MFEKLEIFRMAHAMATHAGTRQAVVARNMANADTPGYAARDIISFADAYRSEAAGFALRATRTSHFGGMAQKIAPESFAVPDQESDPNGNSVSLEREMLRAVDVKRQHDRAIAIYRSSMSILRTAASRR